MAQFNTSNNAFQSGNKTLFEVNQLATANGDLVSNTNPLPVTLGSENITITGNVNVGTTVSVNSTPEDPIHNHITEVGTSGSLDVPYIPVGISSNGAVVSSSNPLPVALGDIMGANVNIYTTVTANLLAVNTNIIPVADDTYTLGNTTYRWESIYIGPGTLYIQDQSNSALNAALTVNNGILQINGSNQLQVGQLKFVNNTIESATSNVDIQIGLTGSSGDLVLNRDTRLAAGKTLTLGSGNTTVAPLKLTAGALLTAPVAGAIEFSDGVVYSTPNSTTRGMIENKMVYFNTAQVSLANNGTQQSIFGLTNGVAVSYATRYRFKIMATVRVTADNVNLFFALGGTATYFRSNYNATVGKGSYGPGMMPTTVVEVYGVTDGQVKNTINISQGGVGGTYFQMNIEGFVDTQYSGYIKPIVLLSPNPGATSFIDSKAYMEIYPVGPAAAGNADTIIGNWS